MPKKPLEKLPEAELDVCSRCGRTRQPVRTARLLEDLADKAWSLSTLKVLLGRLADKSFVEGNARGPLHAVPRTGAGGRLPPHGDKRPAAALLQKLRGGYGRRAGAGRSAYRQRIGRAERTAAKGGRARC